jgi:hydroxymethylglutaryl-CoA reductase (NADPH)
VAARRAWCGVGLPHVAGAAVPTSDARGNVEGMIGYAQVPLGVAGPLVVRGDVRGSFAVPFATNEGTMVASYQRGFAVAAESGGIAVAVRGPRQLVCPVLTYRSAVDAMFAARWIEDHDAELRAAADATSRHGRVLSLDTERVEGSRVILEIAVDTGDAQGANMTTAMAAAILAAVREYEVPPVRVAIHGYDVEKRARECSPRGWAVDAEITVPAEVVARRWKACAGDLAEAWAGSLQMFERMGTPNRALQIANGLAAIYIATGQDAAYVAESAVGGLAMEDRGGALWARLALPSLQVGTVGGGTRKGTAREGLSILAVASARELAGVIGAALLAGDINLHASLCGEDFMGAHQRLGRNRGHTGPARTR